MTILPLIERELRTRARGRALFLARFFVVLVGVLVCLPALLSSVGPWGIGQAQMGRYAFAGLIDMAFFLCVCAGLLTADSISREQREGTLKLLLLTRVGVADVLLGAFGSAAITCLCALAACLPVLILPVLMGGVTGGEAVRKVLALFCTLALALAAGLVASAGARGWLRSAGWTVILLLLLIIGPNFVINPLAGVVVGYSPLSPLGALQYAEDGFYRTFPGRYWVSIAALVIIALVLLVAAGMRLRQAMNRRDGSGADAQSLPATAPTRRLEPGADPVIWLLRRQRGFRVVVWAAVLVRFLYYFAMRYSPFTGGLLGFGRVYFGGVGLAISVLTACLLAWAASRFFIESRRTGELEILLTTPLGAARLVSSQEAWVRRMLFWPLVVLALPHAFQFAISFFEMYVSPSLARGLYPGSMRNYSLFSAAFAGVNAVAGALAVYWMGLWQGLKARSQASAVSRTVVYVVGVPYLVNMSSYIVIPMLVGILGGMWSAPYYAYFVTFAINLIFYSWIIRRSRDRLRRELSHAPPPLSLAQLIANLRPV